MVVVVLIEEKAGGVCWPERIPCSSTAHAQALRVTTTIDRHGEAIEPRIKESQDTVVTVNKETDDMKNTSS